MKGEFFQKDLAEGEAEEGVIKMGIWAPGCKVARTAFGNKGMDMWVPF